MSIAVPKKMLEAAPIIYPLINTIVKKKSSEILLEAHILKFIARKAINTEFTMPLEYNIINCKENTDCFKLNPLFEIEITF